MHSKTSKNNILFWIGIFCAIWFTCFGVFWIYWIALFIAYPIGFISLLIWLYLKKKSYPDSKVIPIVLSVGLLISIITLLYLLLFK